MTAVSLAAAKANFDKFCDVAVNDSEPVFVAREDRENVVIISETVYNNIMENIRIHGNAVLLDKLIKAKSDIEAGHYEKRDLLNE